MLEVEKYGCVCIALRGKGTGIPCAVFQNGERSQTVRGFAVGRYDAQVRFMPEMEGVWTYKADWDSVHEEGDFLCVPNRGNNHGPVRTEGSHFRYADGTPYVPVGTTCYAWVHQKDSLICQTLQSLRAAPFNKVRMCVFPKSTMFNGNDPDRYPFARTAEGTWDVSQPDEIFWQRFEDIINALEALGIEADLILFHPYDRWGFSTLSRAENLAYLDYCVRRLAAFRNVWWSLSNEYDLVFSKTAEDWDRFGAFLAANDPYRHLISAHNWLTPYPKRNWMSHVSWQGNDMQTAFRLRMRYGLPVIVDELGYEGDIAFDWGNLSAFTLVDRMWTAVAFGCYATHGETFYRQDEVLWWSKGGTLYGEAPARIRFLREVLESLPGPMEPMCKDVMKDPASMAKGPEHAALVRRIWDEKPPEIREIFLNEFIQPVGVHPDYRLIYFGRHCRAYADLELPENGMYDVEMLDVWEMTRRTLAENVCGSLHIRLSGKEGLALLVRRRAGTPLG